MAREEYRDKVLLGIAEDLLYIHWKVEESAKQIIRYKREYPNEPDYNLAQRRKLPIQYYAICEFYEKFGLPVSGFTPEKYNRLLKQYLKDVGEAVRLLTSDASFLSRALKSICPITFDDTMINKISSTLIENKQ